MAVGMIRMIFFRRTPIFAIIFGVSVVAVAMTLSACRTSRQQESSQSRRANPSANAARNAGGARMDSLLLIEQKLVEVIDSMASLVDADHARIRELEAEIHRGNY